MMGVPGCTVKVLSGTETLRLRLAGAEVPQ
jgi:hypothetical protein